MPSDGATLADLALELGLDINEYKKWLTDTHAKVTLFDGSVKFHDQILENDVLANETYGLYVPNTIYMAWFGEAYGLGKLFMNWDHNISDMKKLGFHVEVFDNDAQSNKESAKSAFLDTLCNLSENKSIQGMYLMGHASKKTVGSSGAKIPLLHAPLWNVEYGSLFQEYDDSGNRNERSDTIGSQLNYHLGALIIHACEGDNSYARGLVTNADSGGIFWGFSGTYNPVIHDKDRIAKFWGCVYKGFNQDYKKRLYKIGGLQHTKTFDLYQEGFMIGYETENQQ